jgi:hypothetical protein
MIDITYIGLDVHKTTVCVAIAESGRGNPLINLVGAQGLEPWTR